MIIQIVENSFQNLKKIVTKKIKKKTFLNPEAMKISRYKNPEIGDAAIEKKCFGVKEFFRKWNNGQSLVTRRMNQPASKPCPFPTTSLWDPKETAYRESHCSLSMLIFFSKEFEHC